MMTDQTFDSTAFEESDPLCRKAWSNYILSKHNGLIPVVSTVKKGHFDGRVFDYEDLKNTDIAMKQ